LGGKTKTVLATFVALAVMVGLVSASVPLYRLFCKATGIGGTPRVASSAPVGEVQSKTVEIRFDSNVAKGMPWKFEPNQKSMKIRLGEPNVASFTAENPTGQTITGTAAFNVTPAKAGQYVNKIQCFCFSEQTLVAGQKVEMPVQFFIDPAIATDPDTSDVTTITLSYTFFRTPQHNEGAS
jgi:cytochrome c oxidase assembly protein subunit 11